MAILKKPISKKAKDEEIVPMWHKGDSVTFDDGEGNDMSATIVSVDNEAETAAVRTDDGDDYEVEFTELTAVEKKPIKKAKPEPEAEVEEEKPKGKKLGLSKASSGKSSLASALKKTEASKGGGGIPKGKYETIVTEIGINETEKGKSGMIKFCVVNDQDQEGKTGVSFFQLMDKDGEEQQGLAYFKGNLETLGFDEAGFEGTDEDLEEALNDLAEKQMYVEINVVERNGYTNIFLNEVLDQDEKPDPIPF